MRHLRSDVVRIDPDKRHAWRQLVCRTERCPAEGAVRMVRSFVHDGLIVSHVLLCAECGMPPLTLPFEPLESDQTDTDAAPEGNR